MDIFLKRARLIKRRFLAKELCEDGAVSVNGRPARAGKNVVVGDRLTVRLWSRLMELEVESVPERNVSAAESRELYRVLSERRIEETE